jgi:hypothetical protein
MDESVAWWPGRGGGAATPAPLFVGGAAAAFAPDAAFAATAAHHAAGAATAATSCTVGHPLHPLGIETCLKVVLPRCKFYARG